MRYLLSEYLDRMWSQVGDTLTWPEFAQPVAGDDLQIL